MSGSIRLQLLLFFGLVLFTAYAGMSQGYTVEFDIRNYQSDTLIVGNYFGEKQLVKDTLISKNKSKFVWTPEKRPEQGMYLVLLKPENTFVQFLVNDRDKKFSLNFDAKDLLNIKIKGSEENHIDQALLMVTFSEPRTSFGFIDRFLITAEMYDIHTVLLFNKFDTYKDKDIELCAEAMDIYIPLGYPCVSVSAVTGYAVEEVKTLMLGKTRLIAGHSGVGKSTLINTIAPHLELSAKEISAFSGKGVHTTTFATMHELPFGGYIIDTPGIKQFGVVHLEPSEVGHYYREMRELMDWGDINNDSSFELFAMDMAPYDTSEIGLTPWMPMMAMMMPGHLPAGDPQIPQNVLQMQTADGTYKNLAPVSGVAASGWAGSGKFGDLDRDGLLDLYVVNGMMDVEMFHYLPGNELVEENQAYRNAGGSFFKPAPDWNLGSNESGRGMSMADLDNDGDLDIVVNNLRSQAQLFENQLCSGASLEVDLRWSGSKNPFDIGAQVILHTAG